MIDCTKNILKNPLKNLYIVQIFFMTWPVLNFYPYGHASASPSIVVLKGTNWSLIRDWVSHLMLKFNGITPKSYINGVLCTFVVVCNSSRSDIEWRRRRIVHTWVARGRHDFCAAAEWSRFMSARPATTDDHQCTGSAPLSTRCRRIITIEKRSRRLRWWR